MTVRWDRFLLENIAEQALHDANNTGFDLPKCYPGTREAIQKDLSEWVRNVERKHPIYWLYAPAGSGKTAVAKTLADSFSNPATPLSGLLASFFFRRSHVNNEKKFVATIAYQVKTKIPITSRFIIDAIKADPAIFQKDLQVQLSKLILIPLNHASKMVKEKANWPQLIIIDGLDECAGHDAQLTVLDVVSRLALCPFPFAIFISCRPEAHIRGAFQTHIAEPSLKICLPDKYYSDDDIRTFVVGKFQAVVRSHRAFVDFPPCWPGEEVIRQLVKKSSGHFIYAAVVMNYISVSDENPVERLNIILGSLKDPDDENPFATLDALYSHILSSIKKKYRSTVETVLKIAIAQSQVSRGNNHSESDVDLGSFLLLRPGQLRYSLANLEGILLRTHATSSTVTFLHASLIDFLLDKGRSGPHYIDLRISHTEITFYFLHYIFHSGDKSKHILGYVFLQI